MRYLLQNSKKENLGPNLKKYVVNIKKNNVRFHGSGIKSNVTTLVSDKLYVT